MAHVAQYKKDTVADIANLINEYPIVGVVNMQNLPAKQLQGMRSVLRDNSIVLRMTKKRLIKIAFNQSNKKEIEKLVPHMEGMPALIFTKENPFKLASLLNKNKSTAPAKPGQQAPKDISVTAGPTPFAPGPIISQLAKVGIKSGIDKGKIAIKEDSVVARKGEVISAELAGILARLGVEPMEIGINLVAVYEDGTVFMSEVLNIDQKGFMSKFGSAASGATALALEIGYYCDSTICLLVAKAFRNSKAVMLYADIISADSVADLLSKAEAQRSSLSSIVNGGGAASAKEEKQDTKPEKKPEQEAAAGLSSLFG